MIRAALLSCLLGTSAAAATGLPDVGPALAPCLERHITGAPYVEGLRAAGWSVVPEDEKPLAQVNLSEAMLGALGGDHDHGFEDPADALLQENTPAHGSWLDRWMHRDETLIWILSASANRPLYRRGDALLLLMGEQRTDLLLGRLHRTTCLVGAPELPLVSRVLAEAAVVPENGFRVLSFEPVDEAAMPYSALDITRQLPDPVADAPTYLDAVITTQVFPVPDNAGRSP